MLEYFAHLAFGWQLFWVVWWTSGLFAFIAGCRHPQLAWWQSWWDNLRKTPQLCGGLLDSLWVLFYGAVFLLATVAFGLVAVLAVWFLHEMAIAIEGGPDTVDSFG